MKKNLFLRSFLLANHFARPFFFIIPLICSLCCSHVAVGNTIFKFEFQNTEAVTVDNATGTPTFSTVGTFNSAGYFTGPVATSCFQPVSGSTQSRSHAAWNTGDAYRFTVNTTGYNSTLTFSACVSTSNTGSIGTFIIRASSDLSNWTEIVSSFTPSANGTNTTWSNPSGTLPAALQNSATVYIELYKTNDAGSTTANIRIDNATLTAALPLSIDLGHFNAFATDKVVQVEWQTLTEHENDYFLVERALDTKRWETIGTIKGAGTSSIRRNYLFTDDTPLDGKSYYRIRAVDFSGIETLSPIVPVNRKSEELFTIHPTLAYDDISIRSNQFSGEGGGSYEIFSLAGKKMISGLFPENAEGFRVNVGDLNTGIYLIRLTQGQFVQTKQFRKL